MNRRDLVLSLAERTETDRRTADEMLAAFTDIVTETVSTGEPDADQRLLQVRPCRPCRPHGSEPADG